MTYTEWSEVQDFKEIAEEEINILFGLDSNEIKKEVDSARKIKKRENAEKNIEERDNVNIPYDKALMIYSEGSEENRSRRKRIYELNGRYFIEEAEWKFLGGPGPDGRPCIWIWN